MRFAATHKMVSYLMVTTAFLVLALSGELPPLVTALTGLGMALSFFFDPSRHPVMLGKPYEWLWNGLTVLVFAHCVTSVLGNEPILSAGTRFLCFLLVTKLWNRRQNRDYLQAYVLSFFMLVAGTVLNTNVAYAVCFIFYVVFATWTLTLFHLRREMEENYLLKHMPGKDGKAAESERVEVDRILNSRRVVGKEFLAGSALISLGVFLCSGLIFFLTPRIGMGLNIPLQRHGMTLSGFADKIELGGHGRIRDNPQVVLRVEFSKGNPAQPLYFRGVTFDLYERGHWTRTRRVPTHKFPREGQYTYLGEEALSATVAGRHRLLDGTLHADLYLEPIDTPVLFIPSRGVALALPDSIIPEAGVHVTPGPGEEVFARDRKAGLRYSTLSMVDLPPDAVLRQSPDLPAEHDDELDPYLTVPQDLPKRVRDLAAQVTRGAVGPHAKARALIGYLQKNYTYTTVLSRDERYEALEDFLFVQRKGHCEYFASALAVMLRTVGVPSRSVNGYLGGDWNDYGRYLVVRQQNAHSWVEVYLEGPGWVRYDPTPPSALTFSGGGLFGGILGAIGQLTDTLELSWFKYVIEYDLRTQMRMAESVVSWLEADRRRSGPGLGLRDRLRRMAKRLMAPLGSALAAGALGYVLFRLRGRLRLPMRSAPRRTQGLMRQGLHVLERRGFRQRPGETLQQLGARVAAGGDPTGAPFGALVVRYYACRFGEEEVDLPEFRQLTRQVVQMAREHPPAKPA